MIVYVATIETRYPIIGVGTTEDEARRLAGEKALLWLTEQPDSAWATDSTVEDIVAHFCPAVTMVEVGTAAFEGD